MMIPYLCVDDTAAAIRFYKQALGAHEPGSRIVEPGGRIGHASFVVNDATFYVADEHKEIDVLSPRTLGGSPVSFVIHVDDVDAAYKAALGAGGDSVAEPEDQFYGERTASIADPFGYRWSLHKTLEAVDDTEMARRLEGQYNVEKASD